MTLLTEALIIVTLLVIMTALNDVFSLILYAALMYFITAYSDDIFTAAAGTDIQNWIWVYPGIIGTVAIYKAIWIRGKEK